MCALSLNVCISKTGTVQSYVNELMLTPVCLCRCKETEDSRVMSPDAGHRLSLEIFMHGCHGATVM